MLQKTLELNGHTLSYVFHPRRGNKNIYVRVKDDGLAHVSGAPNTPDYMVVKLLIDNFDKIYSSAESKRKKAEIRGTHVFADGVRIRCFGDEYTLKFTAKEAVGGGEAAANDAYVWNGFLVIPVTAEVLADGDSAVLNAAGFSAAGGFIAKRGRSICEAYVAKYIAAAETLVSEIRAVPALYNTARKQFAKPDVVLKSLKGVWGKCVYSRGAGCGTLMFNFSLCGVPRELAEYVAAHEVAHFFVPAHNKHFYAVGERLLPGFRKLDKMLNGYSAELSDNIFV